MSSQKPGSHLSDYEQKRRETAASRRRGIAKFLPETEMEPLPDIPEPLPEDTPKKKKTLRILLLSLLGLLLLVLLGVFMVFQTIYSSMNIQTREEISAVYENIDPSVILEGELEEPEDPVEGAPVLTEKEVNDLDEQLKEGVAANEIFENKDVYNILLLGNDSRANNIAERTDAMILVSINTVTKEIYLTSFLRDIYLHIPDYGSQRLNVANVVGGPSRTVDTIEQNFGISINNYAEVNFIAFENIIDTLGGVDIYLSTAEAKHLKLGSSGGTYHLNGEKALTYCRIRVLDNDFSRTERQRTVLETLWSTLHDISLSDAYELMEDILPQVTTDVTQGDCLNLLAIAAQIGDYELISHSIPTTGTYEITMVKGMSVIVADIEENSAFLRTTVYGE